MTVGKGINHPTVPRRFGVALGRAVAREQVVPGVPRSENRIYRLRGQWFGVGAGARLPAYLRVPPAAPMSPGSSYRLAALDFTAAMRHQVIIQPEVVIASATVGAAIETSMDLTTRRAA